MDRPSPGAGPGAAAGRALRAIAAGNWKSKAKRAAASLKAEYEAGKRGDTSPTTPIWPTPKEQLDALLGLLRAHRTESVTASEAEQDADVDPESEAGTESEADTVAAALRGVDWAAVRAATADRTSEAARAVRTMAAQVDWARIQPIAADVSRALLAAVASGHVGVGGRVGPTIARAIVDQGGLGRRVAGKLEREPPLPPDFAHVIEATATEI